MRLKTYQRYVTSVIVAFLFGIAFSPPKPAYTWEGTSNTISPGYVEGFDGNFTKLYIEDIYLNGVLKNDILAYPTQSYDFLIYQNGNNYAKYGSNSSLLSTSPSGTTVIQSCIDTNLNGSIYLSVRDITLTADINITGDGDRANPIGGWEIHGRGQFATTIYQAENHHTFRLSNGAIVNIHDLEIIIPSTNAETAIYGADDGSDIKNCIINGKFGNLNIEGGGGSSCYAIHLIAPVRWNMYGVSRTQMNGGAGGWKLENTDTLNWGDGCIDGYHRVILNADNMVGYTFEGTPSGSIGPITCGGALYVSVWSAGSKTNITAVKGSYFDTSTLYIQAENVDNFLELYECDSLRLSGPYESMDSAGLLFNVTNGWDIMIGPFPAISVVNQTTIFYDNTATERGVTYYRDISVKMVSGTPIIGTYQLETKFSNVEINQKFSENAGRATIANTTSEVSVTHGLWATPKKIFVQGLIYEEVDRARPDNVGTTTFKIKVPAAVSQDSYVDWYASVGTGWIP